MLVRHLLFAAAAMLLGAAVFAAQDEGARVELKGTLQSDRGGIYLNANGGIYNVRFVGPQEKMLRENAQNLLGDAVVVSGDLEVQDFNTDHAKLIVSTDRIAKFQPEAVQYQPQPVPTPVVHKREIIKESPKKVQPDTQLPDTHINW